jgi:hypothetical protein
VCAVKLFTAACLLPETLSSTEYVRMKKYNEVFDFKCAVCFGSHALPVCRKLKAKQPAVNAIDPPSKMKPKSLEAFESYRPTT